MVFRQGDRKIKKMGGIEMETLIGLLVLGAFLGGIFFLLCAICFVIVRLLDLIKPGKSGSDWIWSMDQYKEDKK